MSRRSSSGVAKRSEAEQSAKDNLEMLEPDKGEEALDMLLAHVAFVDKQLVSFVRLKSPIDAGLEGHAPVRYLFILIGPERLAESSSKLAHALAGVMLDENFVSHMRHCATAAELLKAFDAHLARVPILPHVKLPHLNSSGGHSQHGAAQGATTLQSNGGMDAALAPAAASQRPEVAYNGDAALASDGAEAGPESAAASFSSALGFLPGPPTSIPASAPTAAPQEDDETNTMNTLIEDKIRSGKGMRKRENGQELRLSLGGLQRRPSFGRAFREDEDSMPPQFRGDRRYESEYGGEGDAAPAAAAQSGLSLFGIRITPPLTPTARAPAPSAAPRRRRLFIELVQLRESKAGWPQGKMEWVHTHHWNWAFAQELGSDGLWTRPHLPTISSRAMVHLLEGLTDANVFMELPGTSFAEAANELASKLVANGVLPVALRQKALDTLLRPREGELTHPRNIPAPPMEANAPPQGGGGSLSALGESASASGLSQPLAPAPSRQHTAGRDPAPSLHRPLSKRGPQLDLSPDSDEEAFEMLVANVDYLAEPLMAFVRLTSAIQTGIQRATPVRFLFVLLAPISAPADSVQVAKAFGSIMLDEDFAAAVCSCSGTASFHDLLLRELDCVTIVPSSHIPHKAHSKSHKEHKASAGAGGGAAAPSAAASGAMGAAARLLKVRRKSSEDKSAHANGAAPRSRAQLATEQPPRPPAPAPALRHDLASRPPVDADYAKSAGFASDRRAARPKVQVDESLMRTWAPGDKSQSTGRLTLKQAATMAINPDLFGLESTTPVRKRAQFDAASPIVVATSPALESAADLNPYERWRHRMLALVHVCQAYSLPLLLGILVSLVWANVHYESYFYVINEWEPFPGVEPLEHKLTVKFVINDIFMVFFFGLAAKEVTEACLPGGSLNPPRKALAPLVGTVAGVLGPIVTYLLILYVQFYVLGSFDGYESTQAVAARKWLKAGDATGSSSGHGSGGHASGHGSSAQGSSAHSRLLAGSSSTPSATVDYSGFDFTSPQASLGFEELANGWGVPTATDISLAWMVAVQVFPLRHPAIEFLLLLAVADDAIGLGIIAIKYGDPDHPARPEWLLLVLAGVAISLIMRSPVLRIRHWWVYVLFGGLPSWIGLIEARLHPALALVFIVPTLPPTLKPRVPISELFLSFLTLPRRPAARGGGAGGRTLVRGDVEAATPKSERKGKSAANHAGAAAGDADGGHDGATPAASVTPASAGSKATSVEYGEHADGPHAHDPKAPLHAFERNMKLFIDFGMFFFTLANAGVQMNNIGPLTLTIFGSLVVGKVIWISLVVWLASRCGCAPLNASMKTQDLTMVSVMASIGLTVALFIAGEAYTQERLQSEAKMGALFSGLMGAVCIGFSKTPLWRSGATAARRAKAIQKAKRIRAARGLDASPGSAAPPAVRPAELSVGEGVDETDDEESEVDEDDVAYIIAHALEKSYAVSRAAMLMQERRGILAGRIGALGSPNSPLPSTRRARGSPGGTSSSWGGVPKLVPSLMSSFGTPSRRNASARSWRNTASV